MELHNDLRSHRLQEGHPDFQSGDRGSNPLGSAIKDILIVWWAIVISVLVVLLTMSNEDHIPTETVTIAGACVLSPEDATHYLEASRVTPGGISVPWYYTELITAYGEDAIHEVYFIGAPGEQPDFFVPCMLKVGTWLRGEGP